MEFFPFAIMGLVLLAIVIIAKTATIVPQQQAFVIENLGKYSRTISAGFHILIPFIERVAYKHSLKEMAVDIPEQICITMDNVQVGVDGVLYLQILDPKRASYGIQDYIFAISQLAQTTLRSEIGKIDLDRTFVERAIINSNVVQEVDMASDPWGVKVLRYEIRNINPPRDVIEAMEKQMRAEREKRAVILESEGVRDAQINRAEGEKQKVIKESEARRQSQINEAEGEASAIEAVATATAEGLRLVASAVASEGGAEAMQLRVAEQYVSQFGELAKESNTLVVPANLSDVASMIALATKVFQHGGGGGSDEPEAPPRRDPPSFDDLRPSL
jgi:regulator of protease activity HflC (stomatin/prohibitin superfamily)